MDKIEALKEKIAKLLAKADGTDNPHEAAAFLQKAYELRVAHDLSEEDVLAPEFESIEGGDFKFGSSAALKHELHAKVAEYFGCLPVRQVWRHSNGGKTGRHSYGIHGTKSALAAVEVMFPYVWKDVLRRAGEETKEDYAEGHPNFRNAKRKWIAGIARALILRIDELVAQREHRVEGDPGASTSRALVVTANALKQYVGEKYGKPMGTFNMKLKFSDRAEDIASRISLSRQVGDKETLALPGAQT